MAAAWWLVVGWLVVVQGLYLFYYVNNKFTKKTIVRLLCEILY